MVLLFSWLASEYINLIVLARKSQCLDILTIIPETSCALNLTKTLKCVFRRNLFLILISYLNSNEKLTGIKLLGFQFSL